MMWAVTAHMWQLRAAPIVAGGARLEGMAERATNRGRRCVRDVAWTRLIGRTGARWGPGVNDRVREGERKVGQRSGGVPTSGPDQHSAGRSV
jgi:hypothetical protein